MTTLAQLYDFQNLVVKKTHHATYEKNNKMENPLHIVDQHALLGIEIEVENMKNYFETPPYYWSVKEDNSLRNNGVEFVSIPLRGYQIEYALDLFVKTINSTNTPEFTPRTSVHIHLNARDMTPDQVRCLVLLYTIFEKHFFHIAGTKRESSIFCVPFYKTVGYQRPSTLIEQGNLLGWHKYNALNRGTLLGTAQLPMYGTVEFRHLYGTQDKITIINWINNILKLRTAAMNSNWEMLLQEVRSMNTTSSYVQKYQEIFGEYAMLRKMEKYDFESCVTFAKRWEWGFALRDKYRVHDGSVLFTISKKKKNDEQPTDETEIVHYPETSLFFSLTEGQFGGQQEAIILPSGKSYQILDSIAHLSNISYKLVGTSNKFVFYENTVNPNIRVAIKCNMHHNMYEDIVSMARKQKLINLEKQTELIKQDTWLYVKKTGLNWAGISPIKKQVNIEAIPNINTQTPIKKKVTKASKKATKTPTQLEKLLGE